jgi:hypothetical protein
MSPRMGFVIFDVTDSTKFSFIAENEGVCPNNRTDPDTQRRDEHEDRISANQIPIKERSG